MIHNRFFINSLFGENNFELSKFDTHHIKNVLRLRKNDTIETVWKDKIYECEIDLTNKNSITVKPVKFIKDITKNLPQIILLQSIPKMNKMENLLEKCTELGISKIIPIFTEKVEIKSVSNKLFQRWENIILSAAKQSKRDYVPELSKPAIFEDAINQISKKSLKLLFYEISNHNIKNINFNNEEEIIYFIGPEGSISNKEYNILKDNNFVELKLNLPILKVDTAAITALVTLLNITGKI